MRTLLPDPIPAEHCGPGLQYHLTGHLPTRFGGNLQASRSLDPYYETFYGDGRYSGAISLAQARAMAGKSAVRLPSAYLRARPRSGRDIARSSRAGEVLNLLGTLISFGALTNNQAATITNSPAWADPRSDVVATLFASDLISISTPYLGHSLGVSGDGSVAYQLGDPRAVQRLLAALSYAESLALTGGRDPKRPQVNLRHDILGAELALRAASDLKVGTVLGPRYSTLRDLTAGCPHPSGSDAGADLTIVRPDGQRVAIEVTATITHGFTDKIKRWIHTLNESPLESSGLAVIFLVAPPMAKHNQKVRRTTYTTLQRALAECLGGAPDRVAGRIGIATWREWFPGPTLASERFARLSVDRPTGRGDTWADCDLWEPDDFALPALEPECLRSVIPNSALLSQTPWWLRERHHPAQLAADLLTGHVGAVADVGPQRRRSATRVTGAGQGVASDATIPPRLLGPTDTKTATSSQRVTGSDPAAARRAAPVPEFGHHLREASHRRST